MKAWRAPPMLNSGFTQVMAADALQLRSVSSARLTGRKGSLPDRITLQVAEAVREVIQ